MLEFPNSGGFLGNVRSCETGEIPGRKGADEVNCCNIPITVRREKALVHSGR